MCTERPVGDPDEGAGGGAPVRSKGLFVGRRADWGVVILIVFVLAAASFIHYLKYGREDEQAVPETICDGLLNVEEISRLAHGPVGSEEYHQFGGDEVCSALRPINDKEDGTSPRDLFTYDLRRQYPDSGEPRYKPGGGVKLRVSSLDASIAGGEEGVARIDPPVDGEGDAFLWC